MLPALFFRKDQTQELSVWVTWSLGRSEHRVPGWLTAKLQHAQNCLEWGYRYKPLWRSSFAGVLSPGCNQSYQIFQREVVEELISMVFWSVLSYFLQLLISIGSRTCAHLMILPGASVWTAAVECSDGKGLAWICKVCAGEREKQNVKLCFQPLPTICDCPYLWVGSLAFIPLASSTNQLKKMVCLPRDLSFLLLPCFCCCR